jgi:hypothetical protein
MHKTTICLFMLLCSVAALGQKPPLWKVVQALALTNQTAPIPQTTLFTPTRAGVFRLSVYMSGGGETPGGDWDLSVGWTDLTGASSDFGELQVFTGGANYTQHSPSMLSIEPKTPLLHEVDAAGNTSGSDYNLVITMEQLE